MQLFPKNFALNNTKTSWGLCNSKQEVKLNWRVAMLPPKLIDYVVVHELAHIRHRDHSPAFYAEIAKVLPDYENRIRAMKSDQWVLEIFKETQK